MPASAKLYEAFLSEKQQEGSFEGFDPVWMPDFLYDFQRYAAEWNIRKGKSASLQDCGLGKTPQEFVFGENVVRKTNKPVLLITPLAVGAQMVHEAEKFGIEVHRTAGKVYPGINITNYEKIHHFNPADFGGAICDESSAIKAFDGVRRAQVTEFLRTLPYRLLATATPAPNDYIELGTSSEALGIMGQVDMLNRFFKNDNNTSDTGKHWRGFSAPRRLEGPGWRFKGHAELPFMRWVCSWALAFRRPSDIGFSDDRFVLPELLEQEHIVETRTLRDGALYESVATNRAEELEERRRTITERCEKAAELVANTGKPAVIWCHLNDEGDLLEKLVGHQVCGSQSDEQKEELLEAFTSGQISVLVIKDKIGAWGLNWQHCAHVVRFPSHSFESYYQAVRRCWRFGQKNPVTVDIVSTEGQRGIRENMTRKATQADRMFSLLVQNMNAAMRIDSAVDYSKAVEVPLWV
jgi:hypothetical protein